MIKSKKTWQFEQYIIHEYSELDSTNSLAFELAENKKVFNNEIILADKQNKGRGRKDRQWQSPIGNLYFSIVLQPKIILKKLPQLSLIAVVALNLTIKKIFLHNKISAQILNKWPNDLLINQKKISGILLESKINNENCDFVILGIGVNIASSPDNALFKAGCLVDFGCQIEGQELLKVFLKEFSNLYQIWQNFGFKNIKSIWLENAYLLNQEISLNVGQLLIKGLFQGLDDDGNLLIFDDQELRKINFAEIL